MNLAVLPDIELAKSYPSDGPQGKHMVDVNGRAASIELYLGKHNLTDPQGKFIPVKWGGRAGKSGEYQGEINGRGEIQKRFERDLGTRKSPSEAQTAFPELVAVWQHIFSALTA